MLGRGCTSDLLIICRRAVSGIDRDRFAEGIPDRLQQLRKIIVDQNLIAAVFAAKYADLKIFRQLFVAVFGQAVRFY